ncbi:protein mono-ADP-ribosyltransferase PARP14-like isoform X2 [Mercenaria mercenaria]|nr:protein mono-ADP-ribosyltransferase PARP14-like isoform X2 [Mercenaria mercenaria]
MASSLYKTDCAVGTSEEFLHSFVKVKLNTNDDHTDSDNDGTEDEEVTVPEFGSNNRNGKQVDPVQTDFGQNTSKLSSSEIVKYHNDFETLCSDIEPSGSIFGSGNQKRKLNISSEKEVTDASKTNTRSLSSRDSLHLSEERLSSSDLFGSGGTKVKAEIKNEATSDTSEKRDETIVPKNLTGEISDRDPENRIPSGELFGSGGGKGKVQIETQSKKFHNSEREKELIASNVGIDDDGKMNSFSSCELFDSGNRRNKASHKSSDDIFDNGGRGESHCNNDGTDNGKRMPHGDIRYRMTEKDDVGNMPPRDIQHAERVPKKSFSVSVRSADLFGSGFENTESMEFQYNKENDQSAEGCTEDMNEGKRDNTAETATANEQRGETVSAKYNSTCNDVGQDATPSYHQVGQYLQTGMPYQNPQAVSDMNYATYMPMEQPRQRLQNIPSQGIPNMGYLGNPFYQLPYHFPMAPVQMDEKGQPVHQFFPGMMPPIQFDEKGKPITGQPGMMIPQVYYIPYVPSPTKFAPTSQQPSERKDHLQRDPSSSPQLSGKLDNTPDMTTSFIYDTPYSSDQTNISNYSTPRSSEDAFYSLGKECPDHVVSRNTIAERRNDDNLNHALLSQSKHGESDANIYEEIDEDKLKSFTETTKVSEKGTTDLTRPPLPPASRPPIKTQEVSKFKKHTVPIFDDSNSSGDKEEHNTEGEEESCRTILVRGLSTAVSKDALELYFENKRKTGGGEIVDASIDEKKLEAVIEFKKNEDAKEVIRRALSGEKFALSGCHLHVSEYHPPPLDPLKVFIREIAETTTIECITNFLAASTNSEPFDVVYGETPGTAMASFDTPPDIPKLRQLCDRRKCEGRNWKIVDVELARSVKVTGLSTQTTPDSLCLYFENKRRSQGGDVETTKYREEFGDFIVTFVNAEDAERVCKAKHKLGGKEITVTLFYPCLELDEDFIVRIPPAILLDELEEYIPKFLMNSKKYKADFESKIQTHHGSITWPSGEQNVLEIKCTVDPNDKKGNVKVKNWTETCTSIAKEMTDGLIVDKSSSVAVEVWTQMKERLQEIEVPDPESVAVFLESNVCVIVLVGAKDPVLTTSKQIKGIINDIEKKMENERQIITKKRKLKHYEMALVRASRLEATLKKMLTEFSIDNEQREIIFKGMQNDVDEALAKLDAKLKSFVKKTVPAISKQAIDLLFKKEARDIVKKKMVERKVIGVWDSVRGSSLVMYSKNEKELDVAIEILQCTIVMDYFDLDSEKRDILDSKDGQAKIAEFEENHKGCVLFAVQQNEFRFVCVDDIHKEIRDEFTKLFDLHSVISKPVYTEPGIFSYITTYKKREIEAIENQYKRLSVLIAVKDTSRRPGFIVKGKKDGCKLAIAKLQTLIDSVVHKDHTISWPGFDKYIQSSEGMDCIKVIEINEKCVIKISSEVLSSGLESTTRKKAISPERTEKRGRITKEVKVGSLASENVDVIVNSTNKDLDLKIGAISRTLLKAGGDMLDQECKTKYPDGIKSGEVAVTSGGAMKCKELYHGLLAKWDGGQGHAERVMENFVKGCLTLAHARKYSSIAFPALGTGAMGFPADVVAQSMSDIVDAFEAKHPDTSLRTVRFVIWSEDKVTERAFKDVESKTLRRGPSSRQSYRYSEASENLIVKNKGYSTTIGPVSVSIVKDDLTTLTSGAIVNSTTDDLNLNSGAISKAILAAAGFSIQNEALSRQSRFAKDGFVVTSPGKLMCQNIIHVRARNSLHNWADTIKKCLIITEKLGLNSIAFPALGTGGKGVPPDRMAKLMIETFQDYIKSSDFQKCLKTIRIVIFEERMLDLFISEVKATLDPVKASKGKGFFSDLKFWESKSVAVETPGVTFHIYCGSRYFVDGVIGKVIEIRREKDMFVPKQVLENMEETHKLDLRRIGYSNGAKVVVEKSRVKVMGYGKAADTAIRKTQEYITSVERDMKKGISSSAVKLPSSWTKMKLSDPTKTVLLLPGDPDTAWVTRKFAAESGYPQTSIVKIERIQNLTMFTHYIGKKKQMEIHNSGGRKVEQLLWHGTKSTAVENIKHKGFDRNYNTGASHGSGVYFAVKASMSAQGYCRADANGHKHIFLAHVLTGEYCVGQNGIRVPPVKSITPYATYDSTTDNVQAPNFFVIFHDAQAYPSFLITFT